MLTSYLKYDKLFLSLTDSPDRRASFPHLAWTLDNFLMIRKITNDLDGLEILG
jgi:hypothetical protein